MYSSPVLSLKAILCFGEPVRFSSSCSVIFKNYESIYKRKREIWTENTGVSWPRSSSICKGFPTHEVQEAESVSLSRVTLLALVYVRKALQLTSF